MTTRKIQKWSHYCPPCTLPDKKKCSSLPCQTYNIKAGGTYNGIELSGSCSPFLKQACKEALYSAKKLNGGPFGAVLVQMNSKRNQIIRSWVGHNQVTTLNDPTAHAEIQVIRKACKSLQRIDLSDCILYSSSETCPMCAGSVYWSKIPVVYFAATRYDAGAQGVGFADEQIFLEMELPYSKRKLVKFWQVSCPNSLDAFNYWKRSANSIPY